MRFLNPFPLIPKIAFFHCMVSYADITNIDYMTSKINTWWNIFWLSDKNVILRWYNIWFIYRDYSEYIIYVKKVSLDSI